MKEVYIALGANLGDRQASLSEAAARLAETPGFALRRVSSVYETDPVGYEDQPAFLNLVLAAATTLAPEALLRRLLEIEQEMGRVREFRWGPRTIDLDLLLFEGAAMETEALTLPHPRMGERAFVLVPLREIWPDDRPFPWSSAMQAWTGADGVIPGIRVWGRLDSRV